MIKKLSIILGICGFALLCFSCSDGSNSNEMESKIESEVTACFEAVNAFRAGSEAWYWNEDGSTKTDLTGKLEQLVLDEDLCKVAKIRANEITHTFSHTRPSGYSWYTVLKEQKIPGSAAAENIAAGCDTGKATFVQWKEDSATYSGQGHRRNMLGNYKKIGIACTYAASRPYKYYWVMILTD